MLAIQQNMFGLSAAGRLMRRATMTPRQLYDKCCEPYQPCCDELVTSGFGADESVATQIQQTLSERVAAIRAKMI
ncbi:hypothetical protein NL533_34305, partial [Klebsiella pneumoniae]|nr:hypothetical protein [Klebsiella pneumoniae]